MGKVFRAHDTMIGRDVASKCCPQSWPANRGIASGFVVRTSTWILPQSSLQRPSIPLGFDEVVARGMAKNADQRYRTATELATAAHHALMSEQAVARASEALLPGREGTVPAPELYSAPTMFDPTPRPPGPPVPATRRVAVDVRSGQAVKAGRRAGQARASAGLSWGSRSSVQIAVNPVDSAGRGSSR